MTAWQNLIAGSTLGSGTAWDHLNAQGGGGSGDTYIVDAGVAELTHNELTGDLRTIHLAADTSERLSAEVEQTTLEGEVHA